MATVMGVVMHILRGWNGHAAACVFSWRSLFHVPSAPYLGGSRSPSEKVHLGLVAPLEEETLGSGPV